MKTTGSVAKRVIIALCDVCILRGFVQVANLFMLGGFKLRNKHATWKAGTYNHDTVTRLYVSNHSTAGASPIIVAWDSRFKW